MCFFKAHSGLITKITSEIIDLPRTTNAIIQQAITTDQSSATVQRTILQIKEKLKQQFLIQFFHLLKINPRSKLIHLTPPLDLTPTDIPLKFFTFIYKKILQPHAQTCLTAINRLDIQYQQIHLNNEKFSITLRTVLTAINQTAQNPIYNSFAGIRIFGYKAPTGITLLRAAFSNHRLENSKLDQLKTLAQQVLVILRSRLGPFLNSCYQKPSTRHLAVQSYYQHCLEDLNAALETKPISPKPIKSPSPTYPPLF